MAKRVYQPIGRCIYCDSTDGLTKEHIIPLALDGNLELPDASCPSCQKETHAFGGHVSGRMLKAFRTEFNIRSRRRRPEKIRVPTLSPEGKQAFRDIKMEEHPAPSIMLRRFGSP